MTLLGEIGPLSDPLSAGSSSEGAGDAGVEEGGQPLPVSSSPDSYAANTGDASRFEITLLDDLIVDLADGVSAAEIEAALEAVGGSVLQDAGGGLQLWSITGDVETAASIIADLGVVDAIERNAKITDTSFDGPEIPEETGGSVIIDMPILPAPSLGISFVPNDPYYNSLYGLDRISASEAWERETGSSSVIVGVIDSGIDVDHPDLINNLWVNTGEIWGDGIDNDGNGYIDDYNGYDFVRNAGIGPGYAYDDEDGHGTHVAGTIAAEGNNGIGVVGVAWDAQLMAAKFLDANGSGFSFNAVRAIQYTTANGAQVTNNSWGGGGQNGVMSNAIEEARLAGNLFVAAAGNDGTNNDSTPHFPSNYTHDNVIAVASTTSSDGKSGFSNYGAITVDLAAPGSSIYSTTMGGGYGYKSGTSMAAPHVTGAIALMLSADPTLSYTEIRDALFNSVDPVSSMNGITTTGGRLNIDAALAAIMPDEPISDILLPNSSIDENAAGAVVGTLSAVDGIGAITYSISSDPSGHFEIRGSDLALKSSVSLDHEAVDSYSVTVVGTDADNNTASSIFTVTVGDVNEAPTGITGNGAPSIAEDAGIGTEIGTYTASGDPDDGDTATYSLLDDAGGLFAIDAATGVVTVARALDFETLATPTITVRVTDSGGLSVDRPITITITDQNEAPTVQLGAPSDELYIVGSTTADGTGLYKMSGSQELSRVADINPASSSSSANFANFEVFDDELYFVARHDTFGVELHKIDADGVVSRVSDIATGIGDSDPNDLTAFDGYLYFSAERSDVGRELFRLDDQGNIDLVADINPGPDQSYVRGLKIYGDALYFGASDGETGQELYRVNAGGGVELAADIYSFGSGGSGPTNLTEFNGALYFSAKRFVRGSSATGYELFRYNPDGSVELVADIDEGAGSSFPRRMHVFGDSLYFAALDGPGAYKTWRLRSDGTLTQFIPDPESAVSHASDWTDFNNELYFRDGSTIYKIKADHSIETVQTDFSAGSIHQFNDSLYAFSDSNYLQIDSDGTISISETGGPYLRSTSARFKSGISEDPVVIDGGSPLAFTKFRIDDPDFDNTSLSLSISVSNGSLALASSTGLVFSDANGSDGTLAFDGLIADVNSAFATGLTYTSEEGFIGVASLSLTADDGVGGVTAKTLDIIVNEPANASPEISGDVTGAVYEDGLAQADGALTATNAGATLSWSLQGGTAVNGAPDYNFAIDHLAITKNGNAGYYVDDFGDGIAPPTGATFTGGDQAYYSTLGTFTESGGRAVMDGASAGQFTSSLNGQVYNSHTATLNTNVGPLTDPRGLKSDDDFAVEARFDLVIPDTAGESYGIRLLDDVSFGGTGDDILRLRVVRHSNGNVSVSFDELDTVSGDITHIQGELLNPAAGDDQIVLRLSHEASNPGVIRAAYILMDDGVITSSSIFGFTGHIFGTETPGDASDDEAFTRVRIRAVASDGAVGEKIAGAYGTLVLDENGQWFYDLDNDAAAVQALAAGQTAVDTFTAVVTDEHGATDTQDIDITVTGVNDGPAVGAGTTNGSVFEVASGQPGEDTATHTATGTFDFTDVDLTDAHTVTITPTAGGYRGALTAAVSDASTGDGAGEIIWSYSVADSALDDLNDGDVLTQTYTVTIDDGNGGVATQDVTVTVNGVTDAIPNAAPTIDFGVRDQAIYFSAGSTETGREIYKMSADETFSLVADLNPGADGSRPSHFSVINGELYFSGSDGSGSSGLHKIDRNGSITSFPTAGPALDPLFMSPVGELGGTVYLTAVPNHGDDPYAGLDYELFHINESGAVELVVDLNPGSARGVSSSLHKFRDAFYFAGNDGVTGSELYRLNSGGAIELVAEVNPQSINPSSSPSNFVTFNDVLYFSASDSDYGAELYRLNSDDSIELVADIYAGTESSAPGNMHVFNGALYFQARNESNHRELWRLDADGNLSEIILDPENLSSQPGLWAELNGELYFRAARSIFRIDADHNISELVSNHFGSGFGQALAFNDHVYIFDIALGAIDKIGSDGTVRSLYPGSLTLGSGFGAAAVMFETNSASGLSTNENVPLTIGSVSVADSDSSSLTLFVSAANGALTLVSDNGLAFTDADGSDGTLAFSGNLSDLNDAFASGLMYTPDSGFFGADTLTVTADDGAGGETTATIGITVNEVVDVISGIQLSDSSVLENAPGAVIGELSADGGIGEIVYTILSNPDNSFEIRGNTLALRDGVSLDYEAVDTHSVTVRAADG